MTASASTARPLTGRFVLITVVLFFAVVIGVNVLMMGLAITTLPGTEVDSAYSASLAYQREILAAHQQNARDWKVNAHIERKPDGFAALTIDARDRSGAPLTGLAIFARLQRPVDRLAELGYRAYPFERAGAETQEAERARSLLRRLGVAAFAAMNVMMLSIPVWSGNASDMLPEQRDFFHWLSALIVLPAAAYSAQPFFSSAFAALRARNVNMDVPISIGIVLALAM